MIDARIMTTTTSPLTSTTNARRFVQSIKTRPTIDDNGLLKSISLAAHANVSGRDFNVSLQSESMSIRAASEDITPRPLSSSSARPGSSSSGMSSSSSSNSRVPQQCVLLCKHAYVSLASSIKNSSPVQSCATSQRRCRAGRARVPRRADGANAAPLVSRAPSTPRGADRDRELRAHHEIRSLFLKKKYIARSALPV